MISQLVCYDFLVEIIFDDEVEVFVLLKDSFCEILEMMLWDYGYVVCVVYVKVYGIVCGMLMIVDGLLFVLVQGIFVMLGVYEVVICILINVGDIFDDSVSLLCGFVLKIFDVCGECLLGLEGDMVQDFIMVNGLVFVVVMLMVFFKNLKLLLEIIDWLDGVKKVMLVIFCVIEVGLEVVGVEFVMLKMFGGVKLVYLFGESYYLQILLCYGDYIVKVVLFLVLFGFICLIGDFVDIIVWLDVLWEVVCEELIEYGGMWELCVQLNIDFDVMLIEDLIVVWDEGLSLFVMVVMLEVLLQLLWQIGEIEQIDDVLLYSVWYGVIVYQLLGGINCVCCEIYELLVGFCGIFNGCLMYQFVKLVEFV